MYRVKQKVWVGTRGDCSRGGIAGSARA